MKATQNINKPFLLQIALVPVCKIVIRFGLHFNEFIRNLQQAYIIAAQEILEELGIEPNSQAIAIKTGMDRRTISEHFNNNRLSTSNPLNKMDILIVQLQKFRLKKNQLNISLVELHTIIDSIYAKHIRANAIIKELISISIIEKHKKNNFKINLKLHQHLASNRLMAEDVDITAKRLFETYYKNMFLNTNNNTQSLIQKTLISTKISPINHKKVNILLNHELIRSEIKIKAILKKYEGNVPENTHDEYGVTLFQFDNSPN